MESPYDEYFSECDHFHAPRKLVVMIFGEDLLLHPRVPGSKSAKPSNMLGLCKYCSEIHTKGKTKLRPIKPFVICSGCKTLVWDYGCSSRIELLCTDCAFRLYGVSPNGMTGKRLVAEGKKLSDGIEMWKVIIQQMLWMVDKNTIFQAMKFIMEHYENDTDDSELLRQLEDLPTVEGYVTRLYSDFKKNKDPYEQLRSYTPTTKPH